MSEDKGSDGGDFRYAVGDAKVPWHAVGEFFTEGDVAEVVRFLMPPRGEATPAYENALAGVAEALTALRGESRSASKLTLGTYVEKAEAEAARFLGVRHACYLTNWTAGMEIGYKLSGLRPGDEVIVPSVTFIATIAYPLTIGAKVVFADIDPATVNLDPADVARKITDRTRVIVPVHIGGYPCDMDPIMEIARQYDAYVMEDAAHGLGGTYKGRPQGAIGHFGGYSMHEVKNINSFGEGGLLVSNLDLGEQFKGARFLGLDFSRQIPDWLYDVSPLRDRFGNPQVAGNHSATEFQALGFLLQFKRLESILAARRKNAALLRKMFAEEPAILPPPPETDDTRSTHHLYLLRIDPEALGADIQALKAKLKEKGVTEIAHFGPLYKFDVVRQLGYDPEAIAATCPQTEEAFHRCYTHLPLYPLSEEQVRYMGEAVLESVRELRGAGVSA